MKYLIGLCDDNHHILEKNKQIIDDYCSNQGIEYELDTFTLAEEMLVSYRRFHIVFLDIEMPQMSGFELAEELMQQEQNSLLSDKMAIVFLTSHEEVARDAFRYHAFRFITKDELKDKLDECMKSFLREYKFRMPIQAMYQKQVYTVEQKNIQYLQSMKHGTEIHMGNMVLTTDLSLEKLENVLDSELFIRTHKDQVVNLRFIVRANESIQLTTGDVVFCSRRRRTEVKRRHMEFLLQHMQ